MDKHNLFQSEQALKRVSISNLMSKPSSKVLNERRKSSINTKGSEYYKKRPIKKNNCNYR